MLTQRLGPIQLSERRRRGCHVQTSRGGQETSPQTLCCKWQCTDRVIVVTSVSFKLLFSNCVSSRLCDGLVHAPSTLSTTLTRLTLRKPEMGVGRGERGGVLPQMTKGMCHPLGTDFRPGVWYTFRLISLKRDMVFAENRLWNNRLSFNIILGFLLQIFTSQRDALGYIMQNSGLPVFMCFELTATDRASHA